MKIRLASLNDIEGIAKVHLESWKTTYKNIISDSYLSNITLKDELEIGLGFLTIPIMAKSYT